MREPRPCGRWVGAGEREQHGRVGLSDYDYAFADPTCRTSLGLGPLASSVIFGSFSASDPISSMLTDAGLPAVEPLPVAELVDGGWLSATPYTGTAYRHNLRDGGCEPLGPSPGAFFTLGGPTAPPSFAKMSVVRE